MITCKCSPKGCPGKGSLATSGPGILGGPKDLRTNPKSKPLGLWIPLEEVPASLVVWPVCRSKSPYADFLSGIGF